jgi:hypothetical protein
MRAAMAWAIQSPAVLGLPKLNMWMVAPILLLAVGSCGTGGAHFMDGESISIGRHIGT